MLTTADLQAVAARVTYRPGWRLTVYDGRYEGQHLQICAEVPNAYAPGDTVTLDVHTPIPPQNTVNGFLYWLLWRLLRVESHECREWLRVDGHPVDDPHAPNADRDL